MINRTSLRHPAARARICRAMLTAIRRSRTSGQGVALVNSANAGGALTLGVMYEPKGRRWTFIDTNDRDITAMVLGVLEEARRRLATEEAA